MELFLSDGSLLFDACNLFPMRLTLSLQLLDACSKGVTHASAASQLACSLSIRLSLPLYCAGNLSQIMS